MGFIRTYLSKGLGVFPWLRIDNSDYRWCLSFTEPGEVKRMVVTFLPYRPRLAWAFSQAASVSSTIAAWHALVYMTPMTIFYSPTSIDSSLMSRAYKHLGKLIHDQKLPQLPSFSISIPPHTGHRPSFNRQSITSPE